MAENEKRKTTITSTASLKINVGNFETIDVSKTMTVEIEFSKVDELFSKSEMIDKALAAFVKKEAEVMLAELKRSRTNKVSGKDVQVDLWTNLHDKGETA